MTRAPVPPELELARLLASRRATRVAATQQISELAAAADPRTLADALDARQLLALLGSRLIEAGDAPDGGPFAERVAQRLAHDRAMAMAVMAQTRQVVDTLAAAGIRTMPLKGPSLGARLHGDLGLRYSRDVDVLVARDDVEHAVDMLRAQGYDAPPDHRDHDGLPRLHFTLRHRTLRTVEVHHRVHWYEDRFSQDLLERARPGDDGLLVPEAADEGAALLLFYARDGFGGLRMACDVATWWDRYGERVGEAPLRGHPAAYPRLARTWAAAASAADAVAGVPAAAWTGAPPRHDRRTRLAVRLAAWSQRDDVDQLAANVALVDGLLTPTGSFGRFVIRRSNDTRPRVPHLAKTSARFGLALWRVRRGTWDPLPG